MNMHPFHQRQLGVRAAYTIIELLALIFVLSVSIETGKYVGDKHGTGAGIVAGCISAVLCTIVVVILYLAARRRDERRRRELREKYRDVYRVVALPADANIMQKPQGAEIRVGDYGWEAEPLRDDGLLYLQGLTAEWRVVWYAGFRPDQIERVDEKPQSQYNWNYSWVKSPTICPFPIQARKTPDRGFPLVHIGPLARKP
ncbi:MAG TPA: hypothetical protein VN673_15035 [Clostridia bacterium]|nr:hypothetical protein [Clostridia bacterium]